MLNICPRHSEKIMSIIDFYRSHWKYISNMKSLSRGHFANSHFSSQHYHGLRFHYTEVNKFTSLLMVAVAATAMPLYLDPPFSHPLSREKYSDCIPLWIRLLVSHSFSFHPYYSCVQTHLLKCPFCTELLIRVDTQLPYSRVKSYIP